MFRDLIQYFLDGYRSGKLDQLDWITRNRLVMKKALPLYKEAHRENRLKKDRLKVAFWSPTPWERGAVDHMLALSLYARGHTLHGYACEGGYAACSMESILFKRPDCGYCMKRNASLQDVFGLEGIYRPEVVGLSGEERRRIAGIVESTPGHELENLVIDGHPVGQWARRDLPQFFMRLVDPKEPEVESYFRRAVVGVAENTLVASRFLDRVRPDRAVLTSGRTVSHVGFYQLCRERGLPVVTWDESVGGLGAFIFCLDGQAVNYDKPGVWERICREDLTEEARDFVDYYFSKTSKGQFGRHTYYNNPITDRHRLYAELGLAPDRKLTVLLTNLTWDTSALVNGIFFEDMIHWLNATIEHFKSRPEEQLVIRTHPGEAHLSEYARGTESVTSVLQKKHPTLPSNIVIISGKDEHSSHSLCEMASAIAVYTTSLGIEMAVRGRRVLSIGRSHYRGKGFTTDVGSQEEYFRLLSSDELHQQKTISEAQRDLAIRYAHYFIVRTEAYLDEFNLRDRHSYLIPDPKAFLPQHSKRWDSLCAEIEDLGQFVDCTDYLDPWADDPA